MDRRQFLSGSGIGLISVFAGCADVEDDTNNSIDNGDGDEESANGDESNGEETENGDENGEEEEDEGEEEDQTEEADQPEDQMFSGSGSEVIQDVPIEAGLTVVEAEHEGESNFQITFADDSEFDDYFVNEIGTWSGETAALVDGGDRMVDVEADGDWELRIQQPRAASGDDLPLDLDSSGAEVHGPYEFSGSHIAEGTHDGESNFQVEVFPTEGSFQEIVFNEIGEYEGETTFSHSGVGYVAVNADGNWTLSME